MDDGVTLLSNILVSAIIEIELSILERYKNYDLRDSQIQGSGRWRARRLKRLKRLKHITTSHGCLNSLE
jgi:hypothetical protein